MTERASVLSWAVVEVGIFAVDEDIFAIVSVNCKGTWVRIRNWVEICELEKGEHLQSQKKLSATSLFALAGKRSRASAWGGSSS